MTPKAKAKVRWARVGLIAAGALLLIACIPKRRGVCLGSGKLCIEWNGQPDKSWPKIEAFMVACERTLGMEFTPQAEIVFVPDEGEVFDVDHRGAWFDPESGLIFVEYIDDLWRSEICHELLHREFYLQTGDSDRGHDRPEWDRFCGGRYLVCR